MAIYGIFYDHTEEQSLLSSWILKYKLENGVDTVTFIDTYGDNEATITNHIDEFTADTVTEFWVTVDVAQTHATGNLTYDQVAYLRSKLITASKGTTVVSGTAQANATATEIILAAGSSSVNDFYNSMYIATAGSTVKYRQIKDYVGSTVTATVNTTTTAITTTETYVVFTHTHVNLFGAPDANGKEACLQTWEDCYPGVTPPLLVHFMGYYLYALDWGTAQAIGATSITLQDTASAGGRIADASRANDIFNDKYVYLYSVATSGKNQYGLITDYVLSTEVATVAAGWSNGATPSGATLYRIMDDTSRLWYDRYTELAFKTYLNSLTDADQYNTFKDLIDYGRQLSRMSEGAPLQDLDTLINDLLVKGKAIHDYANLE